MKKIYIYIATGIISLALALVGVSVFGVSNANALECSVLQDICEQVDSDGTDVQNSAIWALLIMVVNIMSGGVIILAIAGVVYAAVLYTTAGDSQEQVKKAKGIITNVVIGILSFVLMYALLQWLIPGGVFNSSGGLTGTGETPQGGVNDGVNGGASGGVNDGQNSSSESMSQPAESTRTREGGGRF